MKIRAYLAYRPDTVERFEWDDLDRTCSHCNHFESEVYHRGKILGSCRQNVYSTENSLCVWDSRPAVENYAVLPHKPCPHFVELSPTKRRFDMWMDRVEKTLTEHRMEEK
jgi:hypothetical protein